MAAFLALLELYKRGELRAGQAQPFGPIRVARAAGLGIGTPPVPLPEHEQAVA
jgi:chromatin segregation and condensation protein Rec8/ScpA/Scc1 (kleisin family)